MRFVEVARFTDLTEPQVAASALRASGIPVILHREFLAQMDVNLVYATGGPGLLVPEADAEAARTFLEETRRKPSTLAPLGPVEGTFWRILSLVLSFATGFFLPMRPRRPERLGDDAAP
jgi:hypothetical protein